MSVFFGREVCWVLAEHGFVEVRQRGSRIVVQRLVSGTTVTVPVPDHTKLRIGTLMSIIRQSGLSRELFEAR